MVKRLIWVYLYRFWSFGVGLDDFRVQKTRSGSRVVVGSFRVRITDFRSIQFI